MILLRKPNTSRSSLFWFSNVYFTACDFLCTCRLSLAVLSRYVHFIILLNWLLYIWWVLHIVTIHEKILLILWESMHLVLGIVSKLWIGHVLVVILRIQHLAHLPHLGLKLLWYLTNKLIPVVLVIR